MNMKERYCAVEMAFRDHRPKNIYTMEGLREPRMGFLNKFGLTETNTMFYQDRDVPVFSKNSFYVLKTNEAKNWHRDMAKLDLSDVIDAVFRESGEGICWLSIGFPLVSERK